MQLNIKKNKQPNQKMRRSSKQTFFQRRHAVAAAAKSVQSCPTLCNPIDDSPLGSSVPGILQTRILECVAISFPSGKNKIPQIYNFAENMENLLSYFKGIECQVYVKN